MTKYIIIPINKTRDNNLVYKTMILLTTISIDDTHYSAAATRTSWFDLQSKPQFPF